MNFVSIQDISILRRAIQRLHAVRRLTAQQRAERYVARMPVAILAG